MYNFTIYFLIFSFLGWCTEVAYSAYKHSRFVNRGFLNGPVCPIYGFGVSFIYLVISNIASYDWIIVLASFLLPTILELVTGFVMEKVFKHKWWDYSGERFNLGGYICLKFSVIWGLACVALVKIVFPLMDKFIAILPYKPAYIISLSLCSLVIIDLICSVCTIVGINKKLKALDVIGEGLHKGSDKIGQKVCDNTLDAIELKDKVFSKISVFHKRMINAFPNIKSKKYKSLNEFKAYIKQKKENRKK